MREPKEIVKGAQGMAKRSFKPSKGRRLRDGPVFKSGRCAVMRTEIRTQHL